MVAALPIALMAGATYMKVQAIRTQTKENVALAKHNAAVETQKAEQLRNAEKTKSEQRKIDLQRLLSKQKTQYAKGGVVGTTGTPLTVGLETAGRGAYDDIMARHNTEIKASQYDSQADMYNFKAKSAKRAGKYAVGAALFSGGAQIAGM